MQKLYRKDYNGEYIVTGTDIVNGVKQETRVFMPNTLNLKHNGYAVVMGNGPSRLASGTIRPQMLAKHWGGINGDKKMTMYACNAAMRESNPYCLVVAHPMIAQEAVDSGYADNNIVVTSRHNIARNPNKFHLTPFDENLNAGATAAYLAAFDGHHTVFLWGFDFERHAPGRPTVYHGTNGYPDKAKIGNPEKLKAELEKVISTYNDTKFVFVKNGRMGPYPTNFDKYSNFSTIDFNTWVNEMNVGMMKSDA